MRILVIEDNQEWQELVKDVLEILPCEIKVVSNYAQAKTALQQQAFDVITLDMELNDAKGTQSGWPLLGMLERGRYPKSQDARVIVLSGSGDFQKSPHQVGELIIKHRNVTQFLWKADLDWDDKLYETVSNILLQKPQEDPSDSPDPVRLRQILTENFSNSELHNLAFDLHVDYEKLQGSGKEDKARGLVEYFARRGRLSELADTCRQLRPHINM